MVTPSPRVFRQLSLDKQLIDFGSYVVGETASRTITLTNTGGLGTRFKFLLASESCEMDASHSVLKRSSLFTCEEKSFCDKVATSVSEQRMEGNESSLPEAPSQRESQGLDAREQVDGRPPESETVTTPPSKEQTEFCLGEVSRGPPSPAAYLPSAQSQTTLAELSAGSASPVPS